MRKLTAQIPVYDFGCGKGDYLKTFEDIGYKRGVGFEGTENILSIASTKRIEQVDITYPMSVNHPGHVMCLEVMEHIPADQEAIVLGNIARFCDRSLVLSWAIEGQNGHGHVNCRNAEYVIPTIEALGFKIDFLATHSARAAAVTDTAFFGQSLYVFKKSPLEP